MDLFDPFLFVQFGMSGTESGVYPLDDDFIHVLMYVVFSGGHLGRVGSSFSPLCLRKDGF